MSTSTPVKTLGFVTFVTFGPCGEGEQTLFRVNADVPLHQALEHASWIMV